MSTELSFSFPIFSDFFRPFQCNQIVLIHWRNVYFVYTTHRYIKDRRKTNFWERSWFFLPKQWVQLLKFEKREFLGLGEKIAETNIFWQNLFWYTWFTRFQIWITVTEFLRKKLCNNLGFDLNFVLNKNSFWILTLLLRHSAFSNFSTYYFKCWSVY